MTYRRSSTNSSRRQGGYALLLVVFFMALLVVSTMSIGLRVLTEGRREKEKELIWRGKQYTRAIKMYYRKTGRFPTTVDNLVQPSVGNIRFLRQAYKDPMNKDDGSWRFIYVVPPGTLIGSLNPQSTNFALGAPAPAAAAAPAQTTNSSSSGFSLFGNSSNSSNGVGLPGSTAGNQSSNSFSLFGSGSQTSPGTTATPTGMGTGTGATGTTTPTGLSPDAQQAALDSDPPTIVGGNIIGVGSKINHSSIMVYQQATNYKLFEFIWNPSQDIATISTGGAPIGAPAGSQGQGQNAPGQSGFGFGQQPGQGGAPGQNGFGFGQPGQGGTGQPGNGNPNPPQQPPTSDPNSNPNPNPQ
jgi:hypothetical protein